MHQRRTQGAAEGDTSRPLQAGSAALRQHAGRLRSLSSSESQQKTSWQPPACLPLDPPPPRLQVYSVDCNPAQSALLELKQVAIRQLEHEDVWALFGEGKVGGPAPAAPLPPACGACVGRAVPALGAPCCATWHEVLLPHGGCLCRRTQASSLKRESNWPAPLAPCTPQAHSTMPLLSRAAAPARGAAV